MDCKDALGIFEQHSTRNPDAAPVESVAHVKLWSCTTINPGLLG